MNRERIERAIKILESVPDAKWDYAVWGERFARKNHKIPTVTCNTKACALGWIACDPWMQEQGLKLEFYNDEGSSVYPIYNGDTNEYAAEEFFEIDYEEAYAIFRKADEFLPAHYEKVSPKFIASLLQRLLDGTFPPVG